MSVDFSQCKVCCPAGQQLRSIHKVLGEIFPSDRPVYDEMIKNGMSFYTIQNYALYLHDEFLGNVGLMPMKIWFKERPLELIGTGAVATVPKYRRQGIAKYLMEYAMKIIDERKMPSVLFTELPIVYEEHGFKIVPQTYLAASLHGVEFKKTRLNFQSVCELDEIQIEEMSRVYDESPVYDGKVIRDKEYWKIYKMLFNPYPKPRIVLCRANNELVGYLRFEMETDRFTITELFTRAGSNEIAEGLLGVVQNVAMEHGIKLATFAMVPGHLLFEILSQKRIVLSPEPAGVRREIFMLRAACGHNADYLASLQWSLADKF
jgi:predicted acetyltransferase